MSAQDSVLKSIAIDLMSERQLRPHQQKTEHGGIEKDSVPALF